MYRAVVLEPEYPGNIGFMARLVENFGIDEYVLVNPQCEVDETARQRASHAQDTLKQARIVPELETAIQDLDVVVGTTGIRVDEQNLVRHSMSLPQLREHVVPEAATGILLGRESTGLTNEELDQCDYTVTIPTTDTYPVMNLSHAAAVIFYELSRPTKNEFDAESITSRREREVLDNLFKGVLETLEWEQERAEKTHRAFRNMVGRASLTGRERQLLLGMFDSIKERCNT